MAPTRAGGKFRCVRKLGESVGHQIFVAGCLIHNVFGSALRFFKRFADFYIHTELLFSKQKISYGFVFALCYHGRLARVFYMIVEDDSLVEAVKN